jgi:hypothetical protein
LKQLRFVVEMDGMRETEVQKYEINLLSNDVENIIIEQAFKMQRFSDSCERN